MTTATTFQEEEYLGQVSWPVWAKLLRYARRYPGSVAALAACAGCLAGLDVVFPLLGKWIVDGAMKADRAALRACTWAYFLMSGGFAVLVWSFINLAGRVSTRLSHDIRRDVFAHLQELSFSYFDRRPVGWLMARLTGDCDRLSRVIAWGTIDGVWSAAMVVLVAAVMLGVDWRCGLIVLSVMPVLTGISVYYQQRILRANRAMRRANSELTASYNEGIMAARTTKTLAREGDALREFQVLSRKMRSASLADALYRAAYMPLVFTLANVGVGLVLWYGGGRVRDQLAGLPWGLSPGTLVAFMSFCGLFFQPVNELARVLTDVQAAQAAAERVIGLLGTSPAIQDSPAVLEAIREHRGAAGPGTLAEDGGADRIETIEFRHVDFAYPEGPPVLRDFNLKVRAGQTIALVGATGGGKTTIVSLLCRFYEPTAGQVLLNGVDYRARGLRWLQSKLGIVLQTAHLFSGTVRENIRYGRLEASDEEIERAARLVGAHPFILRLPDGYDSQVGQGGNRLSTGQRQLVSFARAVLADPQIFVMDEATSSIDAETEAVIQASIRELLKGRTSFIIAHRLSTHRSADLVLVIEGGRVAEQGTHRELLHRRGRYHELYTRQFQQEQEDVVFSQEPDRTDGQRG